MFYNLHFLGFVIDKEKVIDTRNNRYVYEILGYCIYDSTLNKKKYITKNGMEAFAEDKRDFGCNRSRAALESYDISYVARYDYIIVRDFRYDRRAILTEGIEGVRYDIEQDKVFILDKNLEFTLCSCCLFDIKSGILLEGSKLKNYCSALFSINVDLTVTELSFCVVYSFTNGRCEIHDVGR